MRGDSFLLSARRMVRIPPYLLLSHGVRRVDERRVVSGIVQVIRGGRQWKDVPTGYSLQKTLYDRFIRWSRLGVFGRLFAGLAGEGPGAERIMIDAIPPRGPPHGGELAQKEDVPRRIGRTTGGLNCRLHAVCNAGRRPLALLSKSQMSDHKGARLMLGVLLPADTLTGDKGNGSDRTRKALAGRGIKRCIKGDRIR